jgi:hypothetical protein
MSPEYVDSDARDRAALEASEIPTGPEGASDELDLDAIELQLEAEREAQHQF